MDAGTLGVLTPIIALIIPIVAIWTKHQQKMAAMQVGATAEQTAQYVGRIQRLEHRVQVLERIATDRGSLLADEIEALRRDLPAPAATPHKEPAP